MPGEQRGPIVKENLLAKERQGRDDKVVRKFAGTLGERYT